MFKFIKKTGGGQNQKTHQTNMHSPKSRRGQNVEKQHHFQSSGAGNKEKSTVKWSAVRQTVNAATFIRGPMMDDKENI